MKLVFNKQKMISAIAPLMCAVSGKTDNKPTSGILMEAVIPNKLILTSFDLEKGIRLETEVEEVIEEGIFIINAQKFNQAIKIMDTTTLTLTVDEKLHAIIEYGKSVYQMNALRGEDFPTIPKLTSNNSFTIGQKVLKEMLSKISFAMGVDDPRFVLNGCYCEIHDQLIMFVACDGFRLAKCERNTKIVNTGNENSRLSYGFIIPNKTVNEIIRMLSDKEDREVEMFMTHRNMVMNIDGTIFFSRLVDGFYIDYERVLVKNHKIHIELPRTELLSALERASLITEERIIGEVRPNVKLNLEDGLLKISAVSSAGSMYDEIPVKHEGDNLLIAFNNRYLIDSVSSCGGENIKIDLSSPLSSIIMTPVEKKENEEEEFMLLPVRMNNG